jgi:diguanylate cyclase (GGDEF)-like protein
LGAGRVEAAKRVTRSDPKMPDQQASQVSSASGAVSNAPVAADTVASLNEQADDLRAELTQLRDKLEQVKQGLSTEREIQLRDANEALVLAALHSDSIAKAAVNSLSELARSMHRDSLTGTANRALMLDRIEAAIALARRHGRHIAVLFLDLDDFKHINDTLGHPIGDAILQLAARRLEMVVRDSDTVGRLGGDEFIVLVNDVSHASDAALVAEKILATFAAPAQVGTHEITLSASIGIALFPEDGEDAATLIGRADAAMYRAKRCAGGSFWLYGEGPLGKPGGYEAKFDATMSRGEIKEAEVLADNLRKQHLRAANERLVIAAIEANESRERAEGRQREQAKFIAMVAHELRNPLNPIRTASALLKRLHSDEPLLGNLQRIIERQVGHMAQLIEDLLDGSRASAGKFRLTFTSVDIIQVLVTALDTCRSGIEARHQQFRSQLPPSPFIVRGDVVRLTQIFSNLLENASKYTPEGGHITLTLTSEQDTVAVTVADDGIGLTQEALPHIFDLFVQDERALRVHSKGLGIGLAVVRDLVEAHDGSIVASSRGIGLGSEFVVTLPIFGRATKASKLGAKHLS